jgi:phage/plasmid-like protein (TIGR03299 family)
MAHEVQTMAYRDTATPWHGLGTKLPEGQSIEAWQQAAGMDWEIISTPVMFTTPSEGGFTFRKNPERSVLFRSDNNAPLSVVSTNRYQVVQPKEILEFYRELVALGGFTLETAGVLKGGRKLWALAKTNQSMMLKGKDRVEAYLLLATSCDGTLATTAAFTSVRTVCSNTLRLALDGASDLVKVPHSTSFESAAVKKELGFGLSSWDSFSRSIKNLAGRPISPAEAKAYLVTVLGDPTQDFEQQPKPVKAAYEMFSGNGLGSDMASAKGTAWGVLNAVTQFEDWARQSRSPDNRLDSAWFGLGAATKAKAFQEAMALLDA